MRGTKSHLQETFSSRLSCGENYGEAEKSVVLLI